MENGSNLVEIIKRTQSNSQGNMVGETLRYMAGYAPNVLRLVGVEKEVKQDD